MAEYVVTKNQKDLIAIYKGQITQALNDVQMNESQRRNIHSLVVEALDNMMPQEKVEETKVEEDEVICKLLLKGYPNDLLKSVEPIFKSLNAYNPKNGSLDLANTSKYVVTLMIEKDKKL